MKSQHIAIAVTALACIALPVGAGSAAPPPEGAASKPASAQVYDEKADAAKAIDAALAKAKRNHTRVLVQWGANWCGWCKMLHATFQTDKDIGKELRYEYEVVFVDVGRFDRNIELSAKFGADLKKSGLPFLTVIDADGRPVANQETGSLELPSGAQAKGHDVAKVMAFLKSNEAAKVKAADVLAVGVAEAKRDGKLVFLHFGAPWCGWCHRLEDWMARPDIAPILAKAFVDIKIDTDRMPGGQEMLTAHSQGKNGGIPWFELLDANGNALVNSSAPKSGNIGFPAQPEEIAWFVEMLRKSGAKLGAEDIAALEESLAKPAKTAANG